MPSSPASCRPLRPRHSIHRYAMPSRTREVTRDRPSPRSLPSMTPSACDTFAISLGASIVRHVACARRVSAFSISCSIWITKSVPPRIRSSLAYPSRPRRSSRTAAQPPALRTRPPPIRSGCRALFAPWATKAWYRSLPSRSREENRRRTVWVSCHEYSRAPTNAACPLYGYHVSSRRIGTTPARSGLRWRYRTNSRRYGSSSTTIDL